MFLVCLFIFELAMPRRSKDEYQKVYIIIVNVSLYELRSVYHRTMSTRFEALSVGTSYGAFG